VVGASERAGRPSYSELEALVGGQAVLIETLRARIEEQDRVIAELRTRLGQSSRNSSKPPSSDGYGKPPAKNRSLRRRSGRKPGAQQGHPGRHLERREDPDVTLVHPVERCDGCGGDLSGQPIVESQSRQVFDLPEVPRLRCVEHWIQKRFCACCGELRASSFPAEARAPVSYGPRIRAMGIYLVSYQHLPYVRAAEILSDWTGAEVSVGSLQAFVAEGADGLEEFLKEVRRALEGAEVAHFDETGGRIEGELSWIHCASTETLTLYTAHEKRGRDGIDAAGVLPGFEGTAVHDGWAPYRLYEQARHALCGAHHLRELVCAEEQGHGWASAMSALLLDVKDAVHQARQAGRDCLDQRALATVHGCYREIIAIGYEQNPELSADHVGRRPKRTKAQNLLLRLDQRETETMRFASDFQVPFDNNLCERDLRMVKLQQKISGCWRTRQGAERFLAVRSYLSTARKQGQRPAEVLCKLAAGEPWLPLAAGP
jgi:transposase